MGKIFTNPGFLTKMFLKKDRQNALNAAQNPGSFETKTQIPPEKGYDFSYHNLVCPLADFAKKYGYEEYMPYLCNLDYVMFGILGAPLYREHTCFEDGDYCDFKLKLSAKPMDYDPPVFTQGNKTLWFTKLHIFRSTSAAFIINSSIVLSCGIYVFMT